MTPPSGQIAEIVSSDLACRSESHWWLPGMMRVAPLIAVKASRATMTAELNGRAWARQLDVAVIVVQALRLLAGVNDDGVE